MSTSLSENGLMCLSCSLRVLAEGGAGLKMNRMNPDHDEQLTEARVRTGCPVPGKQFLAAALRSNLEAPSAYRLERGLGWVQMGRSGREPRGSYQRPKGTALQGLGQVWGRGREPTCERFCRVSPRISPKAEPSRQTGRGGGERTGTSLCPAQVWEPGAWLLPGVPVPAASPQCPPRCPPRSHSPRSARRADRILRSCPPARHRRSTESSLRLLVPPASVAPIGAPAPSRRLLGPGSPPPPSPRVCLCLAAGGWTRPRGRSLRRGDTARAWRPDLRDPGHEQVCTGTDTRPLLQRNPCAARSSQRLRGTQGTGGEPRSYFTSQSIGSKLPGVSRLR